MNKATIFLGAFFAFLLRAGFVFAFALETHYPTLFGISINNTSTLPEYACYLFALIMNLSFFIAVGVIAFGGVYYLIDYARGKFKDEGKEWMKAGILGLLLIVCASLILKTINPDLNNCKLAFLPNINFNSSSNSSSSGANTVTYQEIPIGTLTENLLARTIDCYGFNPEGNPIDGDQITTDDGKKIAGPTYLDHDRADCLAQVMDGAQKKANVINELSKQIKKLMQTCSCDGKCESTCGETYDETACGAPPNCEGPCSKCQQTASCNNKEDTDGECCDESTKEKIQKGPISVGEICEACGGGDSTVEECPGGGKMQDCPNGTRSCNCLSSYNNLNNNYLSAGLSNSFAKTGFLLAVSGACSKTNPSGYCSTNMTCDPSTGTCKPSITGSGCCTVPKKDYKGLDEFRSQFNNDYESIKQKVESQEQLNKKQITIIKNGGCKACDTDCACDYSCPVCEADNYSCITKQKKCEKNKEKCLGDQPKCEEDKTKCENDYKTCLQKKSPWYSLRLIDQLTYLNGKINEIKQKIKNDADALDLARATLSSCYLAMPYIDVLKAHETANQQQKVILINKTFNDPETGSKVDASKYCKGFNYGDSNCFKKCNDLCPDTSDKAIEEYRKCPECKDKNNTPKCRKEQEDCIKKAYSSRPCTLSQDTSQTFEECIGSCQKSCSNDCSKKYLACSSDYSTCVKQCGDDSRCVLNNTSSCLLNAEGFVQCSNQITDSGDTKFCIDNTYWCRNGSDQYAGYPDCAISQSGEYSASFFYDNKEKQKCPSPNNPPPESSFCYSDKADPKTSCQTLCPETQKCPASSNCPTCPCSQIDATLKFSVPEPSKLTETGSYCGEPPTKNLCDETITEKVLAYRVVGPQCNEYARNDDPLTFYCENSWWVSPEKEGTSETPMGQERTAPKNREVPVGQTVDDAKSWASKILEKKDGLDDMLSFLKKLGDKKSSQYCKCDSKFENGNPICTTSCRYVPPVTTPSSTASDGTYTPASTTEASCALDPCNGNSCQQMIDWLTIVSDKYGKVKTDYVDFYTNMVLKDPRSDIFKELEYSRQKTSDCSLIGGSYDLKTRLLSCTRIEDELVPPVNTEQIKFQGKDVNAYCYGTSLGKLFGKDLTDNWFCAVKN